MDKKIDHSLADNSDAIQISITTDPIDHATLTDSVRSIQCGAVVLFMGTVREMTGDLQTASLKYEAYEPMAISEMHKISENVLGQGAVEKIAIVHRLGDLQLGEIAVGVAVSAPHRQAGFEAAQFIMEQIKKSVPIWKKETWVDGKADWIHPEG